MASIWFCCACHKTSSHIAEQARYNQGMLRRLFSVGFRTLVFAGVVLALLSPVLATLAPSPVQAQAQGNPNIGPNEAQVRPKITTQLSGAPAVLILQPQYSSSWKDDIATYGLAQPLVIRISEVSSQTAGTTDWAGKGSELAAALSQNGRNGAIVVFGNELNNLHREWLSHSNPASALKLLGLTDAQLAEDQRNAALAYQTMYNSFSIGLGTAGRLAPAPPDTANGDYPWEGFVLPIAGLYASAPVRVMNVYQKENEPSIDQQIAEFEAATGPVEFLTEIGIDPAVSDLTAHLEFLNNYPTTRPAATLVPNHCQEGGWQNGGSIDDWLFYVKGRLYDRAGAPIDPESCEATAAPVAEGNAVFLYPDPNLPLAEYQAELDMYLANSQAYCAPAQVFWPERPTVAETLPNCSPGQTAAWIKGELACTPSSYTPVDVTEDVSLASLSFPLFRSDSGGISIESDLSRVRPGESLAQAIERNARADVAPQFYLSTPRTQCQNAVRFIDHVKQLCSDAGYDLTDPAGEELAKCGANLSVRLLDGTYKTLTELGTTEYLPNELVCDSYTLDDINNNTPRAQAVQAIAPYTPKVYKLAFYVQHTFLTGSRNSQMWNSWLRNTQQLVAWFRGQEDGNGNVPEPQERIDVIPVWYHAGLTGSEFDTTQNKAYSIDLREYSTDGSITAKEFDPQIRNIAKITLAAEGRTLNPKTSEIAAPLKDITNYAGPLWQTYAFVLPAHVQDEIALRKLQLVYQNYFLLQFMRDKYFGVGNILDQSVLMEGLTPDVVSRLRLDKENFWLKTNQYDLPFECSIGGFDENDPAYRACSQFRTTVHNPDGPRDGQGLGLSYLEVGAAFPEPIDVQANKSQLDFMKKSVIARINAGVQITDAYQPGKTDGNLNGPLSVREIGTACAVDQANVRQGIQESAQSITSSAIQPLQGAGEDPTTPPRTPVTSIVNAIRAWVYGGPHPSGDQYLSDRVTRSYILLPDEAMAIDTLQSYTSSIFTSPEMYQSLMSGTNPAYPFAEEWERLLAEADEADRGEPMKFSAFLRALGPIRVVTAEDEGYVKAQVVSYQPIACTNGEVTSNGLCGCGPEILRGPEEWMTLDSYEGRQQPAPINGCQGYEEKERRTVSIRGNQPDKAPNASLNVPGNAFALGEYLRRVAFTPLHMQSGKPYTGLEDFYRTAYQSSSTGTSLQCAYPAGEVYDIRDQGYTPRAPGSLGKGTDPFQADLCQVASTAAVDGALLRALLAVEGAPFLNAIVGRGDAGATSYTCEPNSAGAIGPMSRVVGQCSPDPRTQEFFLQDNKKDPDLCTLVGGLTAASDHVKDIETYVRTVGGYTQRGTYEYYERMAERYIGGGSCGEFGDPADGVPVLAPSTPDQCQYNGVTFPCKDFDYCAFVADRAMEEYGGYCQ